MPKKVEEKTISPYRLLLMIGLLSVAAVAVGVTQTHDQVRRGLTAQVMNTESSQLTELSQGWNEFQYLPDFALDPALALASILERVIIVKDAAGNAFVPSLGINTIGDLVPGQNYAIKMNEDAMLEYPPFVPQSLSCVLSSPQDPDGDKIIRAENGDRIQIAWDIEGNAATAQFSSTGISSSILSDGSEEFTVRGSKQYRLEVSNVAYNAECSISVFVDRPAADRGSSLQQTLANTQPITLERGTPITLRDVCDEVTVSEQAEDGARVNETSSPDEVLSRARSQSVSRSSKTTVCDTSSDAATADILDSTELEVQAISASKVNKKTLRQENNFFSRVRYAVNRPSRTRDDSGTQYRSGGYNNPDYFVNSGISRHHVGPLEPGTVVDFTNGVRNIGNQDGTIDTVTRLTITEPTQNYSASFDYVVSGISAGGSAGARWNNWVAPHAGEFTTTTCADANGALTERYEHNNCNSNTFTVSEPVAPPPPPPPGGKPDYMVRGISYSRQGDLAVGNPITFRAGVRNVSRYDAQLGNNSHTHLVITGPNNYEDDELELTAALPARTTESETWKDWIPPEPGKYTFTACADEDGDVDEVHEHNNCRSVEFTVEGVALACESGWTEVAPPGVIGWQGKGYVAAVAYDGLMWVFGGWSGSNIYLNDVWASSDGVNWTEVSPPGTAAWSGRAGHAATVFDGKMWIIGGQNGPYSSATYLNDVWSSTDGVNWTRVSLPGGANWGGRSNHTVLSYDGKLWVMGGTGRPNGNFGYYNDVWSSSDGVTWNEESPFGGADWSKRFGHTSVVHDGKMWVIGGYAWAQQLSDAWSSMDGQNWTPETQSAVWPGRNEHTSVVHDNRIWVMGGATPGSVSDVWSSVNGRIWNELPPTGGTHWSTRLGHMSVVHDDKIWVIGGDGSVGDVWSLCVGGTTQPPPPPPPQQCTGASPFEGGSGTIASPYQICNCQQLQNIQNHLSDHFVLTDDIDCSMTRSWNGSEGFVPIGRGGYPPHPFTGTLDGNNKTISDLYMSSSDFIGAALFDLVDDYDAEIKDLHMTNATIDSIAVAAGSMVGALKKGSVINSSATGNITGDAYVGGLIGMSLEADVTDGQFEGAVAGQTSEVGGLIAAAYDTEVTESYSSGVVQGTRENTGGLAAVITDGSIVTKSRSDAEVRGGDFGTGGLVGGAEVGSSISDSSATGNVTGGGSTGGAVGKIYNGASVSGVFATGDVEGGIFTGGLVGLHTGSVFRSYATGDVSGMTGVGGLVGAARSAEVVDSHATGNVTGERAIGGLTGDCSANLRTVRSYATGSVSGQNLVGGFIGGMDSSCSIADSYAIGHVSGDAFVGGFAGTIIGAGGPTIIPIANSYSAGEVVINNPNPTGGFAGSNSGGYTCMSSYWDVQASGQSVSQCGTGIQPTQLMKQQSTYNGWDFANIWDIDPGINGGYPFLR